jgi:hypothetical protein
MSGSGGRDEFRRKTGCKPTIWALDSSELWRTTNACEGFHSKLKNSCPSPHPNIFVFMDCLKEIQLNTYLGLNSIRCREVRTHNKRTTTGKRFIEDKLEQMKMGEIDLLLFLRCVSFRVRIYIICVYWLSLCTTFIYNLLRTVCCFI